MHKLRNKSLRSGWTRSLESYTLACHHHFIEFVLAIHIKVTEAKPVCKLVSDELFLFLSEFKCKCFLSSEIVSFLFPLLFCQNWTL